MMRNNLDHATAPGLEHCAAPAAVDAEPRARLAGELREGLAGALEQLAMATSPLHLPAAGRLSRGGAGHFHLAAELFLQLDGSTEFTFPDGSLQLVPGACLLVPPRLQHAEQVRDGARHQPFRNLVIYADGAALRVHLAHEAQPGRPGIRYLETLSGGGAARVHGWLADAARLAGQLAPGDGRGNTRWAEQQARGLVVAAVSGVLRGLARHADAGSAEPVLVAEARVLVQNQLGDRTLSVGSLAQQLGRTADYLSQLFRASSGESLGTHITRLRMERAEQLLRDSRMAGKEIAWACGYGSQSYFIRSFRAHAGMTPKEWRLRLEDDPSTGARGRRSTDN